MSSLLDHNWQCFVLYCKQSSIFQPRKKNDFGNYNDDNDDNDDYGENVEDQDEDGDGITMAMVLHERGK